MKLPTIKQTPTPKGKRSIRWNIYGNWVGYVGGRRWKEFGARAWSEREANEWLHENQQPHPDAGNPAPPDVKSKS